METPQSHFDSALESESESELESDRGARAFDGSTTTTPGTTPRATARATSLSSLAFRITIPQLLTAHKSNNPFANIPNPPESAPAHKYVLRQTRILKMGGTWTNHLAWHRLQTRTSRERSSYHDFGVFVE